MPSISSCLKFQLFALLAHLTNAANGAVKFSDVVEFKKDKITLSDNSSAPAEIEFRLKQKYADYEGTTNLYFGSDKFLLSDCTFSFTKANANKWQKMKLIGKSVFALGSKVEASTIEAKVIRVGSQEICESGTSPTIDRSFSKSHYCKAWGDPHFTALNGTEFSYQGVGDYLLHDSGRLVVQGQFTPFFTPSKKTDKSKKTDVSAITSVAFKYQSSSFIVSYKASNILDLKKIFVKEEDGIKVTHSDSSFSAYFPDGSSLVVNSWHLSISVEINLASHIRKTTGICGVLGGKEAKSPGQYTCKDDENMFKQAAYATVKTTTEPFSSAGFGLCKLDSVKCPVPYFSSSIDETSSVTEIATSSDDISISAIAPVSNVPYEIATSSDVISSSAIAPVLTSSETEIATSSDDISSSAIAPVSNVPYEIATSSDDISSSAIAPVPYTSGTASLPVCTKSYENSDHEIRVDPKDVPLYDASKQEYVSLELPNDSSKGLTEEICRKQCKEAIENHGCESLVSSSFYIDACTADFLTTQDKSVVEANRAAYVGTCSTMSKMSGNSTLGIQKELGFGDYSCPNNCTSVNNGKCEKNGCKCIDGFSGYDCSMELQDEKLVIASASPMHAQIVIFAFTILMLAV